MPFPNQDVQAIRRLAQRVAEIASDPVQHEKIELWKRLNSLERVRPLVHVQAIAANIWEELLPSHRGECTDAFCRAQERELRRRIYVWEHFRDDRVWEDVVVCPLTIHGDIHSLGFGMPRKPDRPDFKDGAYRMTNVFETERDVDKIITHPKPGVDWEDTEKRYQQLCELYDGILRVEKRGRDFFWFAPMDTFIQWRGIEEMFVDLVERPAWVHEALERITTGWENNVKELERRGALSPGHGNTMLGSGGYGFTDELPQTGAAGERVRAKDLWARAATQIFTDAVSPAMHEEFAIRYEKRLLEHFGLSCYGCCEPLHNKMNVVRTIGNLRRVSMSPWVDIDKAAEEVGCDYVYTHKPNPTIVSMEQWQPELAEADLRHALERTRDNVLEINLQDLHTVRGEPRRLTEWTRLALRLAEEYA